MKQTLTRRIRRRTASHEGSFTRKEGQQEQNFFGDTTHETFFQPAPVVQRKCTDCEKEEKKLQRQPEKKEEEKKLQRTADKKEEDKVMKMEEKKEEKKVMKQGDKKEEEKVMKSEDKKEEEKIQKKDGGISSAPSNNVSNYIGSLNGKGQPLPASANYFFSSKMGYDFSNVKVHTDKEAAQSAKGVNAKAYTIGNNVVFNEGQYNTQSSEGKKLMAHELTHVIQKGDNIKRSPGDKHDLTSTQLAGDTELEKCFDNERIIRRPSRGTHVKKIQEGLIALGISLSKFGADSDYGSETIDGVKQFQEKAGMSKSERDGVVGRKTLGLLDLSLHNNNISKDEDTAAQDFVLKDKKKVVEDESCKGKPADLPCPDPNTNFDSAAEKAIKLIDKVVAEQLPPVKKGKTDYPAVFAMIFRNNDSRNIDETVKEVKTNYEDTKKFIELAKVDKSHVRCGTECDDGCKAGALAYHNSNAGKHLLTFCPDFNKSTFQDIVLLHESHHAAIAGSKDISYSDRRLIDKLDHAKALLNAASFHLYADMVKDPSTVTIGPSVKDSNSIKNTADKDKVNLALAFIEQWFALVTFDISRAASEMAAANNKGHYLSFGTSDVVDMLHKWFGTPASPITPAKKDVTKAKAVEERTVSMEKAFSKAFDIKETPDASSWEKGPGKDIKLNKQVTDLDINHLVIALLQELVHATPDISAESEPLYVGTINDVRNRRSMDP